MKKTILLLTLACLPVGTLFSQTDDERKAALQVSFIPPMSTQGIMASEYSNAVSFNLLAGISREVTAFSLSGLGMYVKDELHGFHLSGLGTYAGDGGKGLMMSGLFNKTLDYKGVQMGGITNIAADFTGIQFAGLVNMASDVEGAQIAALVNVARKVKGLQFAALVNIAESNDYPVGLVNIIRDGGEMSIGVTYDEIGSTIVGFRSGGRILYGIIGVGFNHKAKKGKFVTEGGLGAHIPVVARFRINNELRAQFLSDFDDYTTSHMTFAVMPAYRLNNLEIFAGPSLNYMYSNRTENRALFPSHSLWTKHTDSRLKQLYIGFSAGVQYIF